MLERHGAVGAEEDGLPNIVHPQDHLFGANMMRRESHGTRTSTTRSAISKHLDVEELEMLLEAYFVQIDGSLNKLSTVCRLSFQMSSNLKKILTFHLYFIPSNIEYLNEFF